ncbi:hypothetical protein SAMN05216559_1361 [Halomicrobium zhouii]|uniref:DUF7993 domain-containing protein n=1 Tax=Halomicrobium zhouii TaxID=767519 RepID=A0A1I6KR96_9EURY|nr:hypothetical protein [Halomicrobium zhouii]SFR93731.1 hypothetical protein SAMN05216559_1361 [Halomicrobium zhouii]
MVEDRITDGKRIAQLLASELTGLSTGPVERLGVDDADPDAEPSPEGSFAYDIVLDDRRVGSVFVHEETARVDLSVGDGVADESELAGTTTDGLSLSTTGEDHLRIHVEYGAAVKRAVDLLVDVLDEQCR